MVGVPIFITLLALAGRLVIETEADNYQAALNDCIEQKDESERCRVIRCFAQAKGGEARANCVSNRREAATSSTSTASAP